MNQNGPFARSSPRPIRALLCLTSVHPTDGGIASANRNVVRALYGMNSAKGQIETSVIAYHGRFPELPSGYLEGKAFSRAIGCDSRRLRFMRQYLRVGIAWRPNLVFVDHLHLAVIPYLFRRIVPVPYVLTCHGIEFDGNMSRLRKAAFAGASARLTNSHFTAERLRRMF